MKHINKNIDNIRRTAFLAVLVLSSVLAMNAQDNSIRDGGEYFLYNLFYGRLLGGNEDNSSPALSVAGTNADPDSYVFVAEASSLHQGYYWLRQKSSGKYLQASNKTGDTWSIWFAGSLNPSYNSYEWALKGGTDGDIISNRGEQINETGNVRIAPDADKESQTYISIYYDKPKSERTVWHIVDASCPLDSGRLKLYTDELEAVISQGEDVYESSLFGTEDDKAELAVALYNARSARADASLDNVELMQTAKNALTAAIRNLQEGNYTIWISGSSFKTSKAFTVALRSATLDSQDEAEVMMVIRNSNKTGAIVSLSKGQMKIGNSTFEIDNTTDAHDYHFAFDGNEVSVWFDSQLVGKAKQTELETITSVGTSAEWTIFGEKSLVTYTPEIISTSAALSPGELPVNEHGKKECTALMSVGGRIDVSDNTDYHIASTNPLVGTSSKVNLASGWVIFDNVRPSDVKSKYLSHILINGKKASDGQNCRIAIYLQGAVVYPYSPTEIAMYGYSGEMMTGREFKFKAGNNNAGNAANELQSFILKRGYMVCLATGSDGSGYSRVYVADHEDKVISVLPDLLSKRISYINIRKWNWVSKKGWASTEDMSAINSEGKLLGTTWFYTWSADRSTQADMEYVPHKSHINWPSWSEINNQTNATAVLGFNEPEHSEQHESSDCSCGGAIDAWKACTYTPEFQASGLRIGSPSPTDASWLSNYIGHCNDMAYRVDFVSFHAYWGTNEAANASAWKSRLQSIYNSTKRPIWLTEWNNGASWTTEGWPSDYNDKLAKQRNAIKSILEVLDGCDFIERYAFYNWDSYYRAAISWDSDKNNWWVTPCGEVYRDAHPTHAYQEKMQFTPVGWFLSMKKDNKFTFSIQAFGRKINTNISNLNGDFTLKEEIEYLDADGNWKPFYADSTRARFDNTQSRAESFLCDKCPHEAFTADSLTLRLKITTLKGDVTITEPRTVMIPDAVREHYTEIPEDVNRDGVVNSLDVLKVYKFMQTSTGEEEGVIEDVNSDGMVNSLDVLKVYKYMQSH